MEDDELVKTLLQEHKREELVEIFDQAINKWLDKKFAQVGKWTLGGVTALLLAGIAWAYVHTGGFK